MKINSLELENVKRIKAVKIEPTKDGLTIVGGKNNQGKTSVLDAIAWALGGDSFKPSKAQRDGSVVPPTLKIILDNGIVVERKGKNSSLKVTDPSGKKAGQSLLNSFINQLALNLPKFMEATQSEKAKILLQVIGVGDELSQLEYQENEIYQNRLFIGRQADQKKKFAAEMPFNDGVPETLISPSELIQKQQDILARNGENMRKRQRAEQYQRLVQQTSQEVERLTQMLEAKKEEYNKALADLEIANTDILDLVDESTEELENNIRQIDIINAKVRQNLDKVKAEEEAKDFASQYDKLTEKLHHVREQKIALLNNANLPLEGLGVEQGKLVYKGQEWDNMSSSDQLKVATAIVRKLNPNCEFVLLDKLEQMDLDTLTEFGNWLKQEGLQVIATRVSTGDECSVIIEDGYVKEEKEKEIISTQTEWKVGVF